MAGKLYGIGVGPGDPELITLKAVRIIKECDVIAVPKTSVDHCVALEIALEAIPEILSKKIIYLNIAMTKNKTLVNQSRDKAAEQIIECLEKNENVAFLTLGDPTIYSTYLYSHKRVINKGYNTQIIPGVPSFCACASALNMGLVEGGEPLHIIPASYKYSNDALNLKGTKVFMKAGKEIQNLKLLLKENNLYKSSKAVQNCGMKNENVCNNLEDVYEESSYFSIIITRGGEG